MTDDPRSAGDLWPGEFVYCPMCATTLVEAPKAGRHRMACPGCDWVHFRNPAVGAAVLVRDERGRVLLVKRGPTSSKPGRWCIPAGYVDYGEEIRSAAARELAEETGLQADIGGVVQVMSNFHDPEKLSVGIWFEGEVTGGELAAGDDAVDAAWFELDGLPDLAFETDTALLGRLGAGGFA